MALSERQQIDYVKDFYWRKYGPPAKDPADVAALKTEAEAVFADATEEITLTGTSAEGGSVSGQIKFNKMIVGMALNELIKAIDPTWTPSPQAPAEREISATVWVG